jgi:hypothetical protein
MTLYTTAYDVTVANEGSSARLTIGLLVALYFTVINILQNNKLFSRTGHEVAQLVEALFYKTKGCGFDSR